MTATAPPTRPSTRTLHTVAVPRRRHAGRRIALVVSVTWIALLAALALVADLLPLPGIDEPVGGPSLPPFSGEGPLLGTDAIGRDVATRL
ncbi:ABC transporter permease, partial [Microbacterium lushaniae]